MNETPRFQVRPQRGPGAYVTDNHTGQVWAGMATPAAHFLADHLDRAARHTAPPTKTYAIRSARTKTTGHIRQDGTRLTYCNRPIGAPNDIFQSLKGWKMCTICVKGEQRDRAEATVTATAALDQQSAGTLPAMVCITHGTACDHNPRRRHEFRPAARTTEPPQLAEQIEAAVEQFARTAHAADAVEHAEQIKAAVETVEQAVTLYDAHLTTEAAANTAPYPIETYYSLDCNSHGALCNGSPRQRHDYRATVLSAEEYDQIAAGTVPPGCYSTADDRPTAAIESRQTAELITEAEASDGTWRGAWIGDATALFDRPTEQGALFA